MTAAQIRTAVRIIDGAGLTDDDVVTLLEMGSEGALLRIGGALTIGAEGAVRAPSTRWMIDRDGRASEPY